MEKFCLRTTCGTQPPSNQWYGIIAYVYKDKMDFLIMKDI